jgi:excisionase family DNA binding protein
MKYGRKELYINRAYCALDSRDGGAEPMMSVKELAKELGVSAKTVYALCDQDAIPFYRIGTGRGTLRFDIDEVKDALRDKPEPRFSRTPIPNRHLA